MRKLGESDSCNLSDSSEVPEGYELESVTARQTDMQAQGESIDTEAEQAPKEETSYILNNIESCTSKTVDVTHVSMLLNSDNSGDIINKYGSTDNKIEIGNCDEIDGQNNLLEEEHTEECITSSLPDIGAGVVETTFTDDIHTGTEGSVANAGFVPISNGDNDAHGDAVEDALLNPFVHRIKFRYPYDYIKVRQLYTYWNR